MSQGYKVGVEVFALNPSQLKHLNEIIIGYTAKLWIG